MGRRTNPVVSSAVREGIGNIESHRNDVAAETKIWIGGANLGEGLAARHVFVWLGQAATSTSTGLIVVSFLDWVVEWAGEWGAGWKEE